MENYKENHIFSSDQKRIWWGDGEWCEEPDLITFEFNGIKCRINRMCSPEGLKGMPIFGGYLCGYCCLPEGCEITDESPIEDNFDCHGGITYIQKEEDRNWIGFDCAHSFDTVPSMIKLRKSLKEDMQLKFPNHDTRIFREEYRNFAFVINECKSLATQIYAWMMLARSTTINKRGI